jgi:hypothetical protein
MGDGKRLISKGYLVAVPAREKFSAPTDMTGVAENPEAAAKALPGLGLAWSMFLYTAARLLKAPHIASITVEYKRDHFDTMGFDGHRYTLVPDVDGEED